MLSSIFKSCLRIVILLVVLFELIGTTSIDWFIFHPVKGGYDASWPGYVDIGGPDGRVAAVVLGPKRGKKAILRCHANAEDMMQSVELLQELTHEGFTVAAVDYPGYGLSDGKPDEAGCYRNVHRLYDWLVRERGFAPKDIVVCGFSVGTGPAVELAATREVGGLILEAPFLSAARVVTRVRLLPVDPFPSISRIKDVKCPLLVIHGTDDEVIPFAHGRKLFDAASTSPKSFVPVEGAGHNDLSGVMGVETYLKAVETFCSAGR